MAWLHLNTVRELCSSKIRSYCAWSCALIHLHGVERDIHAITYCMKLVHTLIQLSVNIFIHFAIASSLKTDILRALWLIYHTYILHCDWYIMLAALKTYQCLLRWRPISWRNNVCWRIMYASLKNNICWLGYIVTDIYMRHWKYWSRLWGDETYWVYVAKLNTAASYLVPLELGSISSLKSVATSSKIQPSIEESTLCYYKQVYCKIFCWCITVFEM